MVCNKKSQNEFSFLEPHGNFLPKSKIERYWEKVNGPMSLHRKRVPKFSVYEGMSYFPVEYTVKKFKCNTNLPSEDWIKESFDKFVKVEFENTKKLEEDNILKFDEKIIIDKTIELSDDFLDDFLINSEWSKRINIDLPTSNAPEDIASSIFDILCNPEIASSKNKSNNDREEFIKKITPTIIDKSRLLFILPGLPFKDQNIFRVPYNSDIPDIGEISFLLRLYNLTQTIYQVHPYGVDIVILTDGVLYSDIFQINKKDTNSYLENLILYRNKLNLQGAVSFICLNEIIEKANENNILLNIKKHILENLDNTEVRESKSFYTLVKGMKWNMNSKKMLEDVPLKEIWNILKLDRNKINIDYKDKWDDFHKEAIHAALEYASINLLLKWTNLINEFFPEAIRGTVHPKHNQFALSNSRSSFPWNGVAVSDKWPKNIDDIYTLPFFKLNSLKKINKVVLKNNKLPLFFTESENTLELAKNVLDRNGWHYEKLYGRELIPDDLEDFINVDKNDLNYTWDRKVQSKDFFISLFDYRLSHYKNFGFGVHGIWYEGEFIGQCGLQVLEDSNDIEVVIFLKEKYINKGLGSTLLKLIMKKCYSLGIETIYGIVREENNRAKEFMKKLNAKSIKTVKHFNQEGILYSIETKN